MLTTKQLVHRLLVDFIGNGLVDYVAYAAWGRHQYFWAMCTTVIAIALTLQTHRDLNKWKDG